MFNKSNTNPFQGKPQTTIGSDANGHPTYEVRARALTVLGAKAAHRLGLVAGIATGFYEFYQLVVYIPATTSTDLLVGVLAPFAVRYGVKFGLQQLFQAEGVFKFSIEGVTVKGLGGGTKYDLDLPLKFTLLSHDREKIEAERLEFLKRKWGRRWWFPQPAAYLNKSSHLSLDQMDQRNDVMTIYGKSNARRIQARLNACLDLVRNHGKAGHGMSFEAEGDWSQQPGALH